MSIITIFFLKKEKDNKFKEFETKWASDPKILKAAKIGWLATRGNHLMQQNQLKEAIDDFKEILKIDPEEISGYTSLASAYATKKDYLNAMKSLRDCKKIIDQSKNEEVKIQVMNIYFLAGVISLETGDTTGTAQAFHMFLEEEKIVTQSPIWQELLKDNELMKDSGIIGKTNFKYVSLRDEHEKKVKFAKETLRKLMVGMKPETQEIIKKIL